MAVRKDKKSGKWLVDVRNSLPEGYPPRLVEDFKAKRSREVRASATIQKLMGHTDIKMTMRYLHAAPDRMKGAVQNLPYWKADCTEFGQQVSW